MSIARTLTEVLLSLKENVATGAGLNLLKQAQVMRKAGNIDEAAGLLLRAATKGQFGGNIDKIEQEALKRIFKLPIEGSSNQLKKSVEATGIKPMGLEKFMLLGMATKKIPLTLTKSNFPRRMTDLGFVPLTGQNINSPGFTLAEFTGKTKSRFIDEGARNLEASINLDPDAAAEYSSFYPRVRTGLEKTGIPLPRVGGAWATLSAQADPDRNAKLLIDILQNPTGAVTTQDNQMLALRFLADLVDDPTEALGKGKRYNFMMNSQFPDDPKFLTADTRYAQNLQGIKNTYDRAPFRGLFDPQERRYGEIYIEPGLEAARRLGMNPNAVQAAAWGNWRNKLFDIPTDLRGDLFEPIYDFDYDPGVYQQALELVADMDPDAWKVALKGAS